MSSASPESAIIVAALFATGGHDEARVGELRPQDVDDGLGGVRKTAGAEEQDVGTAVGELSGDLDDPIPISKVDGHVSATCGDLASV